MSHVPLRMLNKADALEKILRRCESVDLELMVCHAAGNQNPSPDIGSSNDALARYDHNGDGRITCNEAWRHRIAPATGWCVSERRVNPGRWPNELDGHATKN